MEVLVAAGYAVQDFVSFHTIDDDSFMHDTPFESPDPETKYCKPGSGRYRFVGKRQAS